MHASTIRRPVESTDFDLQALADIFIKHKRQSLEYGDIRHRLLRDFPKMTNERQNDLLDHLVAKHLIEKVGYGKWRLVEAKPASPPAQAPAAQPAPPSPTTPTTRTKNQPTGKAPRGSLEEIALELLAEKGEAGLLSTDLATFIEREENHASALLSKLWSQGRIRRATASTGRGFIYYPLASTKGSCSGEAPVRADGSVGDGVRAKILALVAKRADLGVTTDDLAKAGVPINSGAAALSSLWASGRVRREKRTGINTVGRGRRWFVYYPVTSTKGVLFNEDEPARSRDVTVTPAAQPESLSLRLTGYVASHPGCSAQEVALALHISQTDAESALNGLALRNQVRRHAISTALGVRYYPPVTPQVQQSHPPRPFTPAPAPNGTPQSARTVGPPPPPAMKQAIERAGLAPAPKRGKILGELVYTIEVRFDPTDPQHVEALQHLEETCECRTIKVG